MLKLLFSCVLVSTTSVALASDQKHEAGKNAEVPRIEMRLLETDQGVIGEVLSNQKLVNLRIEYLCGTWAEAYEPVTENGRFVYRAKCYYAPMPNTLFSVASQATDKAMEFRASYAYRQGSKDRKGPVMLETVKPNALVAIGCDPAGPDAVLRVINRFRAQWQLPPVTYDPALAAISQTNNAMGGVHAYTGNCRQTWAGTPDPESAVSMWMNSCGHRNIIMAPNLTRGGSHCAANGATFTGNPW
jgi:hypothetical protein